MVFQITTRPMGEVRRDIDLFTRRVETHEEHVHFSLSAYILFVGDRFNLVGVILAINR
jgi:hypothetical protein